MLNRIISVVSLYSVAEIEMLIEELKRIAERKKAEAWTPTRMYAESNTMSTDRHTEAD